MFPFLDPLHPLNQPKALIEWRKNPGLQKRWEQAQQKKEGILRPDLPTLAELLLDLPQVNKTSSAMNKSQGHYYIREGKVCTDLKNLNFDPHPEKLNGFIKKATSLIPWRKGPFQIGDHLIDAEWRSDLKWERILPYLPNLHNKIILDVGCSNGYYMWRMLEHQPRSILGIDPYERFYLQFKLIEHFIPSPNLFYELMGLEDLQDLKSVFDVVFCMGMLYHRRDPLACLKQLHDLLNPQGIIFLETLIIEGESELALCPYPSYAKMANTFFIPTAACLTGWLKRAGFKEFQECSRDFTTIQEQRNTFYCPPNWETLSHFLDPHNPTQTIEGYPAPLRSLWRIIKS